VRSVNTIKNFERNSFAILLVLFILGTSVVQVNAQQLISEPFNYTAGTTGGILSQSAGAWQNINTGDSILVESGSLSYTGLAASTGNKIIYGGSGADAYRAYTSQTSGTVYASFLLNITSLGTLNTTGGYTLGLLDNGTANFGANLWLRLSGTSNFNIGINARTVGANTAWLSTAFSTGTTYLVVISYQIVSGTGNDIAKIWVNPTSFAGTEPTANASHTNTGGTDLSSIQRFYLRQDNASATPNISLDELRVGTTWASVTPAAPSAPTTQASDITFSNSTSSGTTVSWTNGNGNGRIIKANTVNTFTNPTDGTVPSANATYGSGEQVVYAGTGSTVDLTGLVAGQTYYFRVYEYNTTGVPFNTTTATGNPNSTTINFPTPTLTSISPTSAFAGGSTFTLTATGTDFYSSSVINWNGSAKTTTFVNATTLTASITAADIASAGTATVTITNPTPGGGTSSGQTFTINANVSPTIAVTSSFANFIGEALVPSTSQTYTVAGSNLTDNITVTASTGYQVSLDNSSWSSSAVINQSGGSIASTTVYVRLNATASGTYSGTLTHTSSGASDQTVNLNGSAISAAPTTQSALSVTAATANSLTFSMNGGNGAGRILVASTAAVSFIPSDAVAPTGVNANWTLATDQGSSNKIVFDGSGTSVTVSGLTASTIYHFAVYEYNGSTTTINYLQSSPGTTSATTLVAEPTTNSTVSITRITADTAYVSFTGGNGANRIVVVNTTGAVSFSPVDATTYSSANLSFGSAFDLGSGNKLVYQGNATSAKITGFSAGSNFNVTVFEYNGTGSTLNYRSAGASAAAVSPSNISYTSGNYFQDFNTLPTSGTITTTGFGQGPYYLTSAPISATSTTGWQIAAIIGTDVRLINEAGAGTSGSNYNYGSASSTDRAIGGLASGSYLGSVGATFVNNSTSQLNKVTITYVGENWRRGGSGSFNKMLFAYKVGETSIKGTGFTTVPSLDFSTPTPVSGTATAIDGNAAANRAVITSTFTLDNYWLPGQTLTIRWNDVDETGTDDGMAIDSLTFSAEGPSTPLAQDSVINFSNVLTTSMDVNWTNGDATSRIVVMNTSNSFTTPVDGNSYTANNVYAGSGQQIIYNGSGSTVNVTGLTASTNYFFRVFAYNGSSTATKYSTATALQNPNSQTSAAPQAPTKIVVTSLNGGNPILENTPFSITIQAQDNSNSPQPVSAATTIDLTLFSGIGTLGGTVTGTIAAGTNQVTITGVLYDVPDYGAQLQLDATAGDALGTAYSSTFDVYGVATSIGITNLTSSSTVSTSIPNFGVTAYRSDFTVDTYYNGTATISVSSGPSGSITGTLTANFVNGIATFSGIQFSTTGTYILQAIAGSLPSTLSSNLLITAIPTMTELVIPKYMGSKTASSTNNARTPVAFCIQLNNLSPNTIYNMGAALAVTTEANTVMGAGSVWNGTSYGTSISNAFTTNANGSSGPLWIYIQPSGNATRFGAGQVHNLRISYSNSTLGTTPNFISTNTITSLDIATTALSASTSDDGAFVTGALNSCMGGKFVLVYDNTTGTGNPLYAFQAVNSNASQSSYTELPTSLDSIYRNLYSPGSFAAVIPVASLSTSGIQRIETRDLQNNILNSITDADGIWPSGANTTNLVRRGLVKLTNSDASLTTMNSLSVNSTNSTCFGSNNGSATALGSSSNNTVNYLWSNGSTLATQSGLSIGTYTVTVTDGNGCTLSNSVSISQPSSNNPIASNGGPTCIGTDATLSVSNGTSWSWTGPNGFTSTLQNPTVSTSVFALSEAGAQVYTVVVTYADGCTQTTSTTLVLKDCSCTPPTLSSVNTNVLCKNGTNGSIDLTVTGGQAPYTFVWSNGATTEDVSNLAAGTYKVVVIENLGCKDSLTITITEPSTILSSSTTVTNATCNAGSNGSITLNVVGGTSPYSYLWSNSATTKDLSGVVAGTYSVTITDANGCISSNAATITQPAAITITANTITNAACYSLNGSIDISSSADVFTNPSNDPGLLISEFMADPPGTDNSNEWVELIATRAIDFSITPFSVVFANNGAATSNGWKAGAGLTYGFNINSGSVQIGDVVYVGGSLMAPTGTKLRVISTGTVAGDAFGNAASSGPFGNGGTNADAVAVFNVAASSITNTTVPMDAIFFGTALGSAVLSNGTAGYVMPVNDNYNGGYLKSTSYFISSNPTSGKSFFATGTYNYQTGLYSTARTWATDTSSFTNSTSTISVVKSTSYLWSNGATTQDIANAPAGTYTVTVTNAAGCTNSATYTITQPAQPALPTLACYETATFNTTSCSWVVTGTQPAMPTLACYETASFNTTSCTWDVTGTQPTAPTGLACYETATFNTTSCAWVVSGTQPTQPTLACYQTASFNTTTCVWDITGTIPATPALACYETATFNTTTCIWDVTGSQPSLPTLACYETATFNTTTCVWDVTGTQPQQPIIACYETATFNTTSCSWVRTGTIPTTPTLACYETATFNSTTCSWDVTGSPAASIVTTATSCGSYTWSANGTVYTQSGTYNYNSNCQDYDLQLTVVNVIVSGVSPTSGSVGSTVVISGSGFTGATGVQFNGTSATSFTVNNDGQITATVPTGASTGSITVVNGSCNGASSGGFTVLTNATLNLKAYLQGYYAGSGLMTAVLLNQEVSTNTNQVDTITVELRDSATGANVEASAKGVILTDGTISLSLPGSVVGNSYYIVVKHRNSLQTWSAAAVTMAATTSYDFSTTATKAFGDNMIEVETGKFAIFTGDINQDEFIDPFDYPSFDIDNINFESGYKATDLNGDGFIDPFDYPIFDINNINFAMSAHP
jgi:hypothetical protein